MRRVFVDTFYWVAASNPADQWHRIVKQQTAEMGPFFMVTTDEILVEYLAAVSGLGSYYRQRAAQMVRGLLADENVVVLPQTRESFLAGLDLYERRLDKGYRTNDHHFAQEGFAVLITRQS